MNMSTEKTNVLLVTSARHKGWINQSNDPAAEKLRNFSKSVATTDDVRLSVTSLDRLRFSVVNGEVTVYDEETARDLKDFDAVHLRNTVRNMAFYADFAKAIELYMRHHNKQVIEPSDVGAAFGKLSQAVLFGLHDIPTPDTWSQWNGSDAAQYIDSQQISFPLIVKATLGTMGQDNFFVKDAGELHKVLDEANEPFVIQTPIPNKGDYRVLLLGGSRPLIFWRPRIEGSHLSNTSQGSVPDMDVNLDESVLALAKKVQQVSERICVGVDLMQNDQTGEWVILEANNNPALATGAFNTEKAEHYSEMVRHILKKGDQRD
jgi:glutathione synthase/RimK-type ligase-like ATP-grasp enzyme